MFDSRRKSSKFFFSFFSRVPRCTAGRRACFKIKLAGSVLSKNIHHPFLVAFYFIDSTGREREKI